MLVSFSLLQNVYSLRDLSDLKKAVLTVSPVDLDVYIELSSEPSSEYLVSNVDLTITDVTDEGRSVIRVSTFLGEDLNLVCNKTLPSSLLYTKRLTRVNANHGFNSVVLFLYRSPKWLDEIISVLHFPVRNALLRFQKFNCHFDLVIVIQMNIHSCHWMLGK